MKIETIKVNYGRTINMGNFESTRIDVEFGARIDGNEDPAIAVQSLRSMAKIEVKRMLRAEQEKNNTEDLY